MGISGFKVKFTPVALAKIASSAGANLGMEMGGFLIGRRDNGVLHVTDSVFVKQRGDRVGVELLPEEQARVAEKLQQEGGREYIVGWYHSHPGLGVFMSGTDIETQTAYQQLFPEAVAFVIDPADYARSQDARRLNFKFFRVNAEGQGVDEVPYEFIVEPFEITTGIIRQLREAVASEVAAPRVQVPDMLENLRRDMIVIVRSIVRDELRAFGRPIQPRKEFRPYDSTVAALFAVLCIASLAISALALNYFNPLGFAFLKGTVTQIAAPASIAMSTLAILFLILAHLPQFKNRLTMEFLACLALVASLFLQLIIA